MKVKELINLLQSFNQNDEVYGCVNVDEGYLHKPIHSVDMIGEGEVGLYLNLYWIKLKDVPNDWEIDKE